MIIRLHVILVSHIALRRLIELDVRLAAGGRAARTREPRYEPPGDSVQIQVGPVIRERFKQPRGSPVQLVDSALAYVAGIRNPLSVWMRVLHLVSEVGGTCRPS
jgi:hypothetical protein